MAELMEEPRQINNQGVATSVASLPSPAFPYGGRLFSNILILGFAEALAILLALVLGDVIRMYLKGTHEFAPWMTSLLLAWLIGGYIFNLLPGWGLGAVEELRRTVLLLTGIYVTAIALLYLRKEAEQTSRLLMFISFAISLFLVPLVRTRIKRWMLKRGRWGLPVVIYADKETGSQVVETLRDESGLGYRPVGVFTDEPMNGPHFVEGVPIIGQTGDQTSNVPVAILAMPGLPNDRLVGMLENQLSKYRRVVIIPDLPGTPSLWVKPRDFVGILGLEIAQNLLDPVARFLKMAFDFPAIILTAPLWIPAGGLIALLIWLEDRCNPFFAQERVGYKGQLFHAWKFRTMHPNAEAILQKKLAEDEELKKEWTANFKLKKDPRVTRVGHFLRQTSLDELPQLFNVLRGEMSIVGPRPLPRYHHDDLPGRVRAMREKVRPGITGLWQVSGRSDIGSGGMEQWDTYYVRNWSLWLDIVILVRTLRVVVKGHGAY